MIKLIMGVNDLSTWCLSNGEFGYRLAQEWTGIGENGVPMNIQAVLFRSSKVALWRCIHGHEWLEKIANRTDNMTECPYCVRIRNSLGVWCLNNGEIGNRIANEWTGIEESGDTVDIGIVSYKSDRKFKWRCIKGHEWFASIYKRTVENTNCPHCVKNNLVNPKNLKNWCLLHGDLGKQLISEWTGEFDGKKNIDISDVSRASGRKAKWRCSKGHEWFASINNRTIHKSGCPYCSGKRK